mgnify:CR=1 FL=1
MLLLLLLLLLFDHIFIEPRDWKEKKILRIYRLHQKKKLHPDSSQYIVYVDDDSIIFNLSNWLIIMITFVFIFLHHHSEFIVGKRDAIYQCGFFKKNKDFFSFFKLID